jgi:hypothetical protein
MVALTALVATVVLVILLLNRGPAPKTWRVEVVVSRGVTEPAGAWLLQSEHVLPHEFQRALLYDSHFDGKYAWPHEFGRGSLQR